MDTYMPSASYIKNTYKRGEETIKSSLENTFCLSNYPKNMKINLIKRRLVSLLIGKNTFCITTYILLII